MAPAAARAGCLGLGLSAVLLLVGACDERPTPSSTPGEGRTAGAQDPASQKPRKGVRVPLPPGWEARPGPEGDLFIGPSGTGVLRVSARPGEGKSLPTAEALKALLPEAVRTEAKVAHPGPDALVLSFTSDGEDGAVGLIGARRVGGELFLCAGTAALRAEWLAEAADACAGISLGGGG